MGTNNVSLWVACPKRCVEQVVCLRTFQSHSGNVTCLDFSSNGKYLASCADDRTVRIWSTKDFLEREHKCLRANVELDHATLVRFSPDSRSVLHLTNQHTHTPVTHATTAEFCMSPVKSCAGFWLINPHHLLPWLLPFPCRAFITWLANGDAIRIFKMIKKEDGTFIFKAAAEDFPQKHKATILNIGIAETGTEHFHSHVKLQFFYVLYDTGLFIVIFLWSRVSFWMWRVISMKMMPFTHVCCSRVFRLSCQLSLNFSQSHQLESVTKPAYSEVILTLFWKHFRLVLN